MKFNTKTIHGGQIKEKGYGAVIPPNPDIWALANSWLGWVEIPGQ